jgi:hypothetical protein
MPKRYMPMPPVNTPRSTSPGDPTPFQEQTIARGVSWALFTGFLIAALMLTLGFIMKDLLLTSPRYALGTSNTVNAVWRLNTETGEIVYCVAGMYCSTVARTNSVGSQ